MPAPTNIFAYTPAGDQPPYVSLNDYSAEGSAERLVYLDVRGPADAGGVAGQARIKLPLDQLEALQIALGVYFDMVVKP